MMTMEVASSVEGNSEAWALKKDALLVLEAQIQLP